MAQFSCMSSQIIKTKNTVEPRTLLPISFNNIDKFEKSIKLEVPVHLLDIYSIDKQRVAIRVGPGTQFPIRDQIVPKNTMALLLDRLGVWRKIAIVESNKIGWVHFRAIRKIEPTGSLIVKRSNLPMVFATRKISRGWDFKTRNEINVDVPKGYSFRYLKKNENMILVHLNETNSILWLDSRVVQ